MKKKSTSVSFTTLWISTLLLGCVSVSPHENFKNALYANIGYKLKDIQPGWARDLDLIDTLSLPNGNTEYRYLSIFPGPCRYMFEVDPSTSKIVGARFEGNETDCVIYP